MTAVATVSKSGRHNALLAIVMCAGFGGYFLYDGWVSEKYQSKHLKKDLGGNQRMSLTQARLEAETRGEAEPDIAEFQPDANLKFNRIYGPGVCGVGILYFLVSLFGSRRRNITADEKGLTVAGDQTIAYGSIKTIDNRFFAKEGHFTVGYEKGGRVKKLKLSNQHYDNLNGVLDELVSHTGAKPQEKEGEGDA